MKIEAAMLSEIIYKLTGPIYPVGETHEDNERHENVKVLTELVDLLLADIDRIAAENKDRSEHSMRVIGQHCSKFLHQIACEF